MVLRSGYLLIAQQLQEASEIAHSNVSGLLSKAVRDAYPEKYAYYQDHTGDGESGDCIYGCDGEMKSAPYEIQNLGGKMAANVKTGDAKKVRSVVSYPEIADDDDHYASMEESFKAAKLYTELPLYERFISKDERSKADSGSFAGKGKSFPILKPGDVSAAVHAMGRAGSDNYGMAQLKSNIIRIAKAKGWESELPKAWRGEKADESRRDVSRETLQIVESSGPLVSLDLSETTPMGTAA